MFSVKLRQLKIDNRFLIGDLIGKGQFGEINLCINLENYEL